MKANYENVTVSFNGVEFSILKNLFSCLPCLLHSTSARVRELIDTNSEVLDNDLLICLESLYDLYIMNSETNNDLFSVLRQFRDL